MSDPLNDARPMARPRSLRGLRAAGVILLLVAAGVFAAGVVSRIHAKSELTQWSAQQALPSVAVFVPQASTATGGLILPGRLQAFEAASINARVSGYLKAWYADIGTPVKAGQLLGVIEAPELDQQLGQAQANLLRAQASQRLAADTQRRWAQMLSQDSVSRQEADEKAGDLAVQQANVKAAQADVDRLRALMSFTRLVAPFDGTITARNTDVGRLIEAGGTSGPQLFAIASTRKLRLYVNVPQQDVAAITGTTSAWLSVPERPGERFRATLSDTDKSITAASGTLLAQFSVDNAGGALLPGEYAQVQLSAPALGGALRVPASALILRDGAPQLAVLGEDDTVQLKTVQIGTDYGVALDIVAGLKAGERVVDNPPDSLSQGDRVRVTQPATPAAVPVAEAAPVNLPTGTPMSSPVSALASQHEVTHG